MLVRNPVIIHIIDEYFKEVVVNFVSGLFLFLISIINIRVVMIALNKDMTVPGIHSAGDSVVTFMLEMYVRFKVLNVLKVCSFLPFNMSSVTVISPPIHWIPHVIVTMVFMVITYRILSIEIKTRRQQSVKFTTKGLKIWSIFCIASCFIIPLNELLSAINIICIVSPCYAWLGTMTMPISMSFYQLSRLHYCFANSQIHSDKGYPKWVFITMYSIGVIIGINYMIVIELVGGHFFLSKCGINDKFEYYHRPFKFTNTKVSSLYMMIIGVIFFSWDLFTLYLYILKIRTFRVYKDTNPPVYKRIKSILQKIFILTMFYQITGIISVTLTVILSVFKLDIMQLIIQRVIPYFSVCVMSSAMYLMMDHNVKEYLKFLRVVRFLKLNYLCCGWRHFALEQLEDLTTNKERTDEENVHENTGNTVTLSQKSKQETQIEYHAGMPEASVKTDVMIHNENNFV